MGRRMLQMLEWYTLATAVKLFLLSSQVRCFVMFQMGEIKSQCRLGRERRDEHFRQKYVRKEWEWINELYHYQSFH